MIRNWYNRIPHPALIPPAQLQKLAGVLKFWTRGDLLSRQRRTKVLIRLRRCAGWPAPLLLAYDIRHVSALPSTYDYRTFVCLSCMHCFLLLSFSLPLGVGGRCGVRLWHSLDFSFNFMNAKKGYFSLLKKLLSHAQNFNYDDRHIS